MTPARMARRGWRGSPLLLLPQWGLALTLLLACSFSETTGSRTEESSSGGGPGAPGADTGTRTCSAGGGAEPSDNVLCSPGTESEPLTVHCAQNGACKTRSHGGGGEGGEGNPREDDDSGRRGKAGGGGEVIKERLVVRQLRDGTHALVSMQQRTSTRLPRGASSPISTSLFPAFLLRLVRSLHDLPTPHAYLQLPMPFSIQPHESHLQRCMESRPSFHLPLPLGATISQGRGQIQKQLLKGGM